MKSVSRRVLEEMIGSGPSVGVVLEAEGREQELAPPEQPGAAQDDERPAVGVEVLFGATCDAPGPGVEAERRSGRPGGAEAPLEAARPYAPR